MGEDVDKRDKVVWIEFNSDINTKRENIADDEDEDEEDDNDRINLIIMHNLHGLCCLGLSYVFFCDPFPHFSKKEKQKKKVHGKKMMM